MYIKQKPIADSNSWFAVHKPGILNTEPWFNQIDWYKQFNKPDKSPSFDVES